MNTPHLKLASDTSTGRLINLTPHDIVLCGVLIPASGKVARVTAETQPAGGLRNFLGTPTVLPLVTSTYGDVTGLPESFPGDFFIVSAMVRAACPHRRDIGSPAKLVRDDAGRIVGCEALEVNP